MAANPPDSRAARASWRRCLPYFAMPVGAALLMMVSNMYLVPRELAAKFFPVIEAQAGAWTPAALASIYHMSIAGVITLLLCAALIFQCAQWQREMGAGGKALRPFMAIFGAAVLAILVIALRDGNMIDDGATRQLFTALNVAGSELDSIHPPFLFGFDSRIWGAAIFISYLVAAATTAIAAATPIAAGPGGQDLAKARMTIVRNTLLIASMVMLSAVVTAKLRFDIGLNMLPVESGAYSAYQMIANAIMNYWAATLSIGLALIYGPPALRLYRFYPPDELAASTNSLFNRDNAMRLVRLVAILAPPLVSQLINLVPGAS